MALATTGIATYDRIAIPTNGRAVLVGKTESGKSTVASRLIQHFRATNPKPRVLILDSKPRFRGTHELNGMLTSRRYRKWRRGETVPQSVVLPSGVHVRHAMKQTWRLGYDTAIAQIPSLEYLDWLKASAAWFYEDADDSYQQLLYIDELADFFSSSGAYGRGNVLVQAVRSGRERGVAVMAGTQRPSGIPPSFFTELSRIYLFRIHRLRDIENLQETVLPENIQPPKEKHVFLMYDASDESVAAYKLRLDK